MHYLLLGIVLCSGISQAGEIPVTKTLEEVAVAVEQNYCKIDTLAAVYDLHETMPGRKPRSFDVHFAWDQAAGKYRSHFVNAEYCSDTITTGESFIRVRHGKKSAMPAAMSVQFWSSDVLAPARLFGTGRQPLWEKFRDYAAASDQVKRRITFSATTPDRPDVYTMRMTYVASTDNEKLFMVRKLAREHEFNPTLVTKSVGTDIESASLVETTSWTYKRIKGIVVPQSITHTSFSASTGEPQIHRSWHLRSVKINEELPERSFDPNVRLAPQRPTLIERVYDLMIQELKHAGTTRRPVFREPSR